MLFVPPDERYLGFLGQDEREQLAGQWQDSHFDEDGGWWVGVCQAGATFALATVLSLAVTSTTLATSVFSQSQDDPAGSLINQPAVQEEYWQNPVAPTNWPQPSVFTDDDIHVQFVQVFTPDEDFWAGAPPPTLGNNYIPFALPFIEQDQSPQFIAATPVVDAGDIWAPQLGPSDPNWTLLFFLDDGSAVHVFEADEDFWAPQIPPQNWPQPQQPFSANDEDQQVPEFVAAEEPLWLQLTPPVPASLVWPQQFLFEQNESTNLIAFTTEEYWQNPTPPVPDGLLWAQQFVFEQHEPAGSLHIPAFEETLWQNPVSPVADSLKLLQQFPFEQNEPAGNLRNTVDEDFWQNPVPPVIWPQVSPFVFDEIVGQPSASTVDEIYWSQLVAPTPATLGGLYGQAIYLPDVEEIPAGSLVPFIPPPPVFCPLPPVGPDKDVSMSVFSNFRGGATLALFCRICKSGKPLVVRADYAIWCQDCCAFVSKQDTYMGTVQAPGAFKNIF